MAPPIPNPPSDAESVYAMSDDDEGDYDTIRSIRTGKGVKLLFSKSKVYIHPTPSAKDNIPGFIALLQQKPPPPKTKKEHSEPSDIPPISSASKLSEQTKPQSVHSSSLLLAWVPESSLGDAYDAYVKVDLSDSSSPPKQTFLVPPLPTSQARPGHASAAGTYAFAIPVSEIYSLLVRPPSVGWWFGSVVINTRAGDSFPALFFHDSECESTILQRKKLARESFDPFGDGGGMFWGGDEVLRWLKRYVPVERSGQEPSVYLIEPSPQDKLSFGKGGVSNRANGKHKSQEEFSKGSQRRDGGMTPVAKVLKEAQWNLLERLSQVTTFTRRLAEGVADNPKLPPQVRRLMKNPEVQTLQDEFDSARIYLARWAMGIAEQGEREKQQRIWTAKDVIEMEDTGVGEFEILDVDASGLSLADRRHPLTKIEWEGFFDERSGKLQVTLDEVKERIFHGGLDSDDGVRKEAWLFLLGVYSWDSTADERHANMNSRRDEYIRLKGAWWERLVDGSSTPEDAEWWREQKGRIEKDVHRTDRNIPLFAGEDTPHPDPDSPFADVGTNVHLEQMKDMLLTYNEYNKDLGYVQGMSDLLAPIYAVVQDDAVAFWGFANFMNRMERNFLRDQSGMRTQLLTLDHLVQLLDPKLYEYLQKVDSTNFFFFFRMLLVWYKREFDWIDVLRLWESLWTDYLSANFHLFVATAILEKHRDVIMNHLRGFDEVLKYVNDLSNTIDLPSTLVRAEALFRRFQRMTEAIDKKNNFPAPSLRQRKPTSSDEAQAPAESSSSGAKPGPNATATTSSPTSADKSKVISPELRSLLSRKPDTMDSKEVREHGGGVGR